MEKRKQNKKAFSGQGDSEKVIKTLFRHPFVLVKGIFAPCILIIFSFLLMLSYTFDALSIISLEFSIYIFLVAFIIFVFSLTWIGYAYFTWVRDKFFITNQRIIDIEQVTLFTRSQKEAPLERIQDVSVDINGFWGSIFHFGTVTIQTASDSALTLNDVSRPEIIQQMIFDIIKDEKKEKGEGSGVVKKMIEMLKSMGAKEADIKKELEKSVDSNKEGQDL